VTASYGIGINTSVPAVPFDPAVPVPLAAPPTPPAQFVAEDIVEASLIVSVS
jgi:hypothetical protein